MKRENSKVLTKIERALRRLEVAQTRVQIKNARTALSGALRSLKAHVGKAYPIPKKPEPSFEENFLNASTQGKNDGQTQNGHDRKLVEWIREQWPTWYWKTKEVQEFVNAVSDQFGVHCEPLTLLDPPNWNDGKPANRRIEYQRCDTWTRGPGDGIQMDTPKSATDQQRLVWVLHKLAHVIRTKRRKGRRDLAHTRLFRDTELKLLKAFVADTLDLDPENETEVDL